MLKRFLPRFSLRTLIVLVTLVCVYFAAWEITKRKGVPDVRRPWGGRTHRAWVHSESSPIPFIVSVTETGSNDLVLSDGSWYRPPSTRRQFIWFFGWTWETPIQWEVPTQPDSP